MHLFYFFIIKYAFYFYSKEKKYVFLSGRTDVGIKDTVWNIHINKQAQLIKAKMLSFKPNEDQKTGNMTITRGYILKCDDKNRLYPQV